MTSRRRQSRSRSRGRRPSIKRSRSRSTTRGRSRRDPPRSEVGDKKFFVPYRCLIPQDAAGSIIGKGAVLLRSLVDATGVEVQVLRSEENPRGLEDRIVVLNGPPKAKDDALNWVLSKLREHFKKRADENMTFVSLVPMTITSLIIGNRGATIRDLSQRSKAEIGIGKETVRGTSDAAVTLKGRPSYIAHAMFLIHRIVQELHNRGELIERDFAFCNIFTSQSEQKQKPEPRPEVSDDFTSGIDVRIVVSNSEADFITARDGGFNTVRSIEKEFNCLVSLEEHASEEIMVVSAERYIDKANATCALLRLLHKKDSAVSILIDHSEYVLGGLETISRSTGCALKQSLNGIDVSGPVENQLDAIRLLLARIDASASKKVRPSQPKPDTVTLVVSLPHVTDRMLEEVRKKSGCGIVRQSSDLVHLSGQKREILKAVEELVNIAPGDRDEPMYIDEEERRRHVSDFSDDEVDYS